MIDVLDEAVLHVYRDGMVDAAWQATLRLIQGANAPNVVDHTGRSLLCSGALVADRFSNDVRAVFQLRYRRQDYRGVIVAGPPARMEWDFPLEMKELQIPFSFDNLPLPPD